MYSSSVKRRKEPPFHPKVRLKVPFIGKSNASLSRSIGPTLWLRSLEFAPPGATLTFFSLTAQRAGIIIQSFCSLGGYGAAPFREWKIYLFCAHHYLTEFYCFSNLSKVETYWLRSTASPLQSMTIQLGDSRSSLYVVTCVRVERIREL